MLKKFRVLIIGLGNIGMGYDYKTRKNQKNLTHASAFSKHKNFELIGGIDFDKKKCLDFEKKFHVESSKFIHKAMIEKNPDIVVISTNTHSILDNLENVLNNLTPKVILLEKPISYDFRKAKTLISKATKKKISIFINYMRLSDPNVNKIKNMILNWEKPFKGTVTYSKGLFNGASHFINLLGYWFGDVLDYNIINKGSKDNQDYSPDFQLRFKKGTFIFYSQSQNLYFHNSIDLFCPNIRLKYDFSGEKIFIYKTTIDPHYKNYLILKKKPFILQSNLLCFQDLVVDNIFKFLNKRHYNICDYQNGLKTLKVLDKLKSILE